MKRNFSIRIILALLTIALVSCAGAKIVVAQTTVAPVMGVSYDSANGTCQVTFLSAFISGTMTTDAEGEMSCDISASATSPEILVTQLIESLDTVFASSFPSSTGTGSFGTSGGVAAPESVPSPFLSFLVNNGTTAAIASGASATFSWEAINIAPNTCVGKSSPSVTGWTSTPKQPSAAMTSGTPVTFNETVWSFPGAGTYTFMLSGCMGADGSVIPNQSVTVIVGVPAVSIASGATGISADGATLIGSVSFLNATAPVTSGFDYGTTTSYGSVSSTVTSPVTGTITSSFDSLQAPIGASATPSESPLACGTLYHDRAWAANSVGTGYSGDSTFTTLPCATGGTGGGSSGGSGTTVPPQAQWKEF